MVFLANRCVDKFAISGVAAPDGQGAKTQQYRAYYAYSQRCRAECVGAKNVKLFLRGP
jgi:hypothetical protein